MARYKPTLTFAGSLEVETQEPLDARTVVPTKADLTVAGNFPYAYKGLPVYVEAEQKVYVLTDLDTTDIDNWKEVGSGEGNTVSVELTQAQYDALTPAEKNNGTVYFITDGQGGGGGEIGPEVVKVSTSEVSEGQMVRMTGTKNNRNMLLELLNANSGNVRVGLYDTQTESLLQERELATIDYVDSQAGLEKIYSTTERKVGTYLGKDLYEVTLTGMTIQGAPSSGQVTWYNLTTQKNIQRSWTIVDFESLAADGNSSSATKYVNQILIVRGGGNGDWNVGNSSTTPMYVRGLTLRYVKEAL